MGWHRADVLRALADCATRLPLTDLWVGRTITEPIRQVLLSGAAVTVPFVVTFLVLGAVLDFIGGLLAPFARLLAMLGLTGGQEGVVAQALVLAIILGVVFLAGLVAEAGANMGVHRRLGGLMGRFPGVGSVYSSFDRMSQVMLDGENESFREVKLVEFPHAGVYSLAFQTSEVDDDVTADGEKMLVLFVPLAPNPVMGGFMACVPAHRAKDVDMTVQEAFQAIVTSGVAMTGQLRG